MAMKVHELNQSSIKKVSKCLWGIDSHSAEININKISINQRIEINSAPNTKSNSTTSNMLYEYGLWL